MSAAVVVLVAFGYAPAGHARLAAETGASPAEEYIPFVTDFPKPGASPAEEYIPFITDFPKPVAPAADVDARGTDSDVGTAGAVAAALAALAGSALVLKRRARLARA